MTLLRSALRSISILGLAQLVMWVAAFVFTLAQARALGPIRFGELSVAVSYGAFVSVIVDFGLGTQLSRMVAQRESGHETALAAAVLIRVALWTATLPLVALATFAFGYGADLRAAILLITLSMLFVGIANAVASYLQGREEFLLASIAQVTQRLLTAALGIAVLVVHPDLVLLGAAFVAGGLANVAIVAIGVRRAASFPRTIDTREALRLCRRTIPLAAYAIANAFYWSVDMIMLERLAPAENVGWYAAAYRLFSVATIPATLIAGVALSPVLARLAVGARAELRTVIEKSLTFLILTGAAAALVFALFAEPLIALLYPAQYAPAAASLRLLAPALVFIHVNWVFASSLLGLHAERRLLRIAAVAAVFNPLANLVAIPLWHQDGAALVTSLTELVLLVSLLRAMPRDLVGREPGRVAAKAVAAAALVTLAMLPVRGAPLAVAVPLAVALFATCTFVLQAVSKRDLLALRALVRPAEARP